MIIFIFLVIFDIVHSKILYFFYLEHNIELGDIRNCPKIINMIVADKIDKELINEKLLEIPYYQEMSNVFDRDNATQQDNRFHTDINMADTYEREFEGTSNNVEGDSEITIVEKEIVIDEESNSVPTTVCRDAVENDRFSKSVYTFFANYELVILKIIYTNYVIIN